MNKNQIIYNDVCLRKMIKCIIYLVTYNYYNCFQFWLYSILTYELVSLV